MSDHAWKVWRPDESSREDASVFRAPTPPYAVEAWARHDDAHSADYRIVRGNDATVHVCREDDETSEPLVYIVYGEPVALYSAKLKVSA